MHLTSRAVIVTGLLAALTACGDRARNDSADNPTARTSARDVVDVSVAVRPGVITAPDTVRPGWTRVGVDEVEGEHIVVVFRLSTAATPTDLAEFVAALDTAPATPGTGLALGGPEVGARGDVMVQLTPGVHVLACVRRGADGHRHATTGEARVLHVRSATAADSAFVAPPTHTQTMQFVDFAYVGPDTWAPGAQLIRIENTGRQDHQLRLARLRDGASLQAWMEADDPGTVATDLVGMARLGAGAVAYLPVDLTPGSYVAYCLVTDGATKKQHVELGMLRAIEVR